MVTCCMRGRYTMLNAESLGAANLWGGKATCSFVCYAILADESIDSVGNWSYHVHDFIMGPAERVIGVPLAGAVVTCHCTYVGHVLDEAFDATGASTNVVKCVSTVVLGTT